MKWICAIDKDLLELQQAREERQAARRWAREEFLFIRARAAQDQQEKKEELKFQEFEALEWDETFKVIREIRAIYELER